MVLTQSELKEYFVYERGHLKRIKSSGPRSIIGRNFGSLHKTGYIKGKFNNKPYLEHRLIWFYHYGDWPMYIDHINGDRSDNRVENLRVCTAQQNSFNRKGNRNVTSNYKGVYWHKRDNVWAVEYRKDGKKKFLGYYSDEVVAAKAYDNYVRELHGEYRRLNFG